MNEYLKTFAAAAILLLGAACGKQDDTSRDTESAAGEAMEAVRENTNQATEAAAQAGSTLMEAAEREGAEALEEAQQAGEALMQDAEGMTDEAMKKAEELKEDLADEVPENLKEKINLNR